MSVDFETSVQFVLRHKDGSFLGINDWGKPYWSKSMLDAKRYSDLTDAERSAMNFGANRVVEIRITIGGACYWEKELS